MSLGAAAAIGAPAAGCRSEAASRSKAGAGANEEDRAGAAVAAAEEVAAPAALLQWACIGWEGPDPGDEGNDDGHYGSGSGSGRRLRVTARELGPGRGRGLVAAADIAPGEVLLSVPLTRVFTSEPDSELHWSAEMALRLLRARHLAAATATPATVEAGERCGAPTREGPGTLGEAGWGPWIRALPAAVRTPLEYDEEEVRQLGCPYIMEEVAAMQQCVRDCFEVLQPELAEVGCGWTDFLWAVQIFHSRCFFEPSAGLHMCVPGVDLANHCPRQQPNAGVRLQHSPGACQGYEALAEVAEPPPPEPSRFNLVAGDAGIRCGEEVTISYGRWPSEAFLLLFGFVPSAEGPGGGRDGGGEASEAGVIPGECLTVFRDAEEAVQWCLAAAQQARKREQQQLQQQAPSGPFGAQGNDKHDDDGDGDEEGQVQHILQAVEESMPQESLYNLTVTDEGVDGRLQGVLEVAGRRLGLGLGARELLRARLRERRAHFCSGAAADGDNVGNEAIRAFVRSKRTLAERVLARL